MVRPGGSQGSAITVGMCERAMPPSYQLVALPTPVNSCSFNPNDVA